MSERVKSQEVNYYQKVASRNAKVDHDDVKAFFLGKQVLRFRQNQKAPPVLLLEQVEGDADAARLRNSCL